MRCSPDFFCVIYDISAGCNIERPIQLFQHHHARQMMGKRHRRHGQPQLRGFFEAFIQSARTAYQHTDVRHAASHPFAQLIRELFTGQRTALNAHGNHGTACRNFCADCLRFFGKRRVNLRL